MLYCFIMVLAPASAGRPCMQKVDHDHVLNVSGTGSLGKSEVEHLLLWLQAMAPGNYGSDHSVALPQFGPKTAVLEATWVDGRVGRRHMRLAIGYFAALNKQQTIVDKLTPEEFAKGQPKDFDGIRVLKDNECISNCMLTAKSCNSQLSWLQPGRKKKFTVAAAHDYTGFKEKVHDGYDVSVRGDSGFSGGSAVAHQSWSQTTHSWSTPKFVFRSHEWDYRLCCSVSECSEDMWKVNYELFEPMIKVQKSTLEWKQGPECLCCDPGIICEQKAKDGGLIEEAEKRCTDDAGHENEFQLVKHCEVAFKVKSQEIKVRHHHGELDGDEKSSGYLKIGQEDWWDRCEKVCGSIKRVPKTAQYVMWDIPLTKEPLSAEAFNGEK